MKTLYLIVFIELLFFTERLMAQPDSLWSIIIDEGGRYDCCSLLQTIDGELVLAGDRESWLIISNFVLVKVDKGGGLLWSQNYPNWGSSDYYCNSMIQTSAGGFALAGCKVSGGGERHEEDSFILITNADGDSLWSRTYGSAEMAYDECTTILQTDDGGFALVGIYGGFGSPWIGILRINENGDSLWYRTCGESIFRIYSAIKTSDGGFAVAGEIAGGNGAYPYLVRMNDQGDVLWTQTYVSENDCRCYSLIQTSDDGFALAGVVGEWPFDFYLLRVDEDGERMWSRRFEGEGNDECYSLIETEDGGFAMGGYTASLNDDLDFWLLRTNHNGDSLWSCTFGGPAEEDQIHIIQTIDRGFVLAGVTRSFEEDSQSIWLLKTGPDPVSVPFSNFTLQPSSLLLLESYPNPLNGFLTTSYKLPAANWINLSLYSNGGQFVQMLAEGWRTEGEHRLGVNTAGLPAGGYWLRLTDKKRSQAIQPIVLIK